MADKCFLCEKELETTFLDKVVGTIIKNKEGKKVIICNICQREHKDKLKEKIS